MTLELLREGVGIIVTGAFVAMCAVFAGMLSIAVIKKHFGL